MKHDVKLAVLMLVLFAALFAFDSANNYSENAIFGNRATGAVIGTNSQEGNFAPCIESDNKIDYEKQGTVKYNLNQQGSYQDSLTDSCSDSVLNEYYCDANGYAQTAYYNCPNGCNDGACKSSQSTTGAGGVQVNPASSSSGQGTSTATGSDSSATKSTAGNSQSSSSGSSQDVCMVAGSMAKCSLNGREYETTGRCIRSCKANIVQAQTPSSALCAGNGETETAGKQCCSGLVPCNFCDKKCYNSCPDALCKAPGEFSCQSDSECLSGTCTADSAGNKKCGAAGVTQPPSTSASQQDVCMVAGSMAKCSLNGREYETTGRCIRSCKANLVQQAPGSGQSGESSSQQSDPDLVVRLTDVPAIMYKGETYQFEIYIMNNGGKSSLDAQRRAGEKGFATSLAVVSSAGKNYPVGTAETIGLLPSDALQKVFSWTVPVDMPSGNYKYLAIADYDDSVLEVNEKNNRDEPRGVAVADKP